jgi:hypothetical protein
MKKSNVLVDEEIICSVIDESDSKNSAISYINDLYYDQAFWIWIQEKKGFNPDVDSFLKFKSQKNWKQFLRHEENKGKKAHAEYLKECAYWYKRVYGKEKKAKK